MRRLLAVLVVILVGGAFGFGFWMQRQPRVRAEQEAAELGRQLQESRSQLAATEAKARMVRLFGLFLALKDAVVSGNYGEAQALSTPFFDGVRDEAAETSDAAVRTSLDAVLMRRDTVTAGLARGEGSVREVLVPIERELRRALGFPVLPLAPAPAVATGALPSAERP